MDAKSADRREDHQKMEWRHWTWPWLDDSRPSRVEAVGGGLHPEMDGRDDDVDTRSTNVKVIPRLLIDSVTTQLEYSSNLLVNSSINHLTYCCRMSTSLWFTSTFVKWNVGLFADMIFEVSNTSALSVFFCMMIGIPFTYESLIDSLDLTTMIMKNKF